METSEILFFVFAVPVMIAAGLFFFQTLALILILGPEKFIKYIKTFRKLF